MMNRHVLLSALAAGSILLSGCGLQPLSAPEQAVGQRQAAAKLPVDTSSQLPLTSSSSQLPAQTPAPLQQQKVGGIQVVSESDLTDQELQQDANADGYSTLAVDTAASDINGFVRRTDTGYFLENTYHYGFLFLSTGTNFYPLQFTDPTVATLLDSFLNRKVAVTGTWGTDALSNVLLKVTGAKRILDMGVLTNWLTKGRVAGHIHDLLSLPLSSVEVKAQDKNGFWFLGTTDAQGEFAIKNLTAGAYTLTISRDGYDVASSSIQVKSRKAVRIDGSMIQAPAH